MGPTSPEQSFEQAEKLLRDDRADEAEAILRDLTDRQPVAFMARLRLGQLMEYRARVADAIMFYESAIAANPGHALPFTRRAVLVFRNAFGSPPPPRTSSSPAPRVAMTTLGSHGRFGNQLIQYGVLRTYAAQHGFTAEAPDWIGRDLFDLDDPLPSSDFPVLRESEADLMDSLRRPGQARHGVDIVGYFCGSTRALAPHRARFRQLYRPGARIAGLLKDAQQRLLDKGDTLIAVHLRRGDFGSGPYWIAPAAWYLEWLQSTWESARRPVLYLATDGAVPPEFARFRPTTMVDLKIDVPGAEFYPDFHVLTQADALAISNSTFSFVAAMLNSRTRTFMRPERQTARLISFDPWDSPVLT